MADGDLLKVVRDGWPASAAALFERYAPRARAAARAQLRGADPDTVDDVVSEAFTRLFEAVLDGSGQIVDIGAYLCRIAHNLAIDRRRQLGRIVLVGDLAAPRRRPWADEGDADGMIAERRLDQATPQAALAAAFECSTARAAFECLPASSQETLETVVVGEVPIGAAAAAAGVAPSVMASRSYRAKEALRQSWVRMHLASAGAARCRACTVLLGAYVRDALGVRRRCQVERHLAACAECRQRADAAREANDELPPAPPRRRTASRRDE